MKNQYSSRENAYHIMLKDFQLRAQELKKRTKWKKHSEQGSLTIKTLKVSDESFGGSNAAYGTQTIHSVLSPLSYLVFSEKLRKDMEMMKRCEPDFSRYDVLHEFGDCLLAYVRVRIRRIFVDDRDLVLLYRSVYDITKNKLSIYGGSADTEGKSKLYPPIGQKCNRGNVYCFMWEITKPTPTTLRIQYLNLSNAGGRVNVSLTNLKTHEKVIRVSKYATEFLKWSSEFGIEKLLTIEEKLKSKLSSDEEKKKKRKELSKPESFFLDYFEGLENLESISEVDTLKRMIERNKKKLKDIHSVYNLALEELNNRIEEICKGRKEKEDVEEEGEGTADNLNMDNLNIAVEEGKSDLKE